MTRTGVFGANVGGGGAGGDDFSGCPGNVHGGGGVDDGDRRGGVGGIDVEVIARLWRKKEVETETTKKGGERERKDEREREEPRDQESKIEEEGEAQEQHKSCQNTTNTGNTPHLDTTHPTPKPHDNNDMITTTPR